MAALLTISALSGCAGEPQAPVAEGAVPHVPAMLTWHEEPPIGSELNHRLVRASRDVAARLEERWGKLQPRIYTIAPQDRAKLADALRGSVPAEWEQQDLPGASPPDATLHAFASGGKLFAALVVEPGEASVIPVVILRNKALLDATASLPAGRDTQ